MKSTCLVVVILLLFVGISTFPTIAYITVDLEYEKEPVCMGKVYGCVGNSHGMYTWTPYPFALVTTENKRVRCDHTGDYSMYLPLNQEYDVTAYVLGYNPLTKHVVLSDEASVIKLTFDMCGRERTDIKPLEKSKIRDTKSNSLGTVTVNVTVYGWYFTGSPFNLKGASVYIRVVGIIQSIVLGKNLIGSDITSSAGRCSIEVPAPNIIYWHYLVYAKMQGYRPIYDPNLGMMSFLMIKLKANDNIDMSLELLGK